MTKLKETEMFEYSWMLVFEAINGLLTADEIDSKEECMKAASQNGRSGDRWNYKKFCLYSCAKLLLKVVHMSEQFILKTIWKHKTKSMSKRRGNIWRL